MPSLAHERFQGVSSRAATFLELGRDHRLRPIPRRTQQALSHAALAVLVSAWEAYLEELVREFYSNVYRPTDAGFASLHTVALTTATQNSKKFNTPNWDNARQLLISNTGYDPHPDWAWPSARMSTVDVKERLDQVLQVRHAFAHGFPIPAFDWTTTPTGATRLQGTDVVKLSSFFSHLVKRTDRGLKAHIGTRFGVLLAW